MNAIEWITQNAYHTTSCDKQRRLFGQGQGCICGLDTCISEIKQLKAKLSKPITEHPDVQRLIMQIVQLEAELKQHQWIPISSEILPENSKIVLIACDDGNVQWVESAFCNVGTWTPNGDSVKYITHWKPRILPKQALEEKKG